jgi:P27 family predicted phage terminase small subunit
MGKRGPKPLPAAIKKARGTFQPCRAAKNGWTPPVGSPSLPTYLSDQARKIWRAHVAQLVEVGILTVADGDAFARYCAAEAQHRQAQRLVDEHGSLMFTPFGPKTNPMIKVAREAREQATRIGSLFGLDPSCRVKLEVPKKPERDAAAEFLGLTALPGGKR